MKGTFKFLIPSIEINQIELQIWNELKEGKIEENEAINRLSDLKANGKSKFFQIKTNNNKSSGTYHKNFGTSFHSRRKFKAHFHRGEKRK